MPLVSSVPPFFEAVEGMSCALLSAETVEDEEWLKRGRTVEQDQGKKNMYNNEPMQKNIKKCVMILVMPTFKNTSIIHA